MTRHSATRLLKIVAVIAIALLIAGYAVSRSLNYARGPAIYISEPENGTSVPLSTVDVKGRAERVSDITLNGEPISIDEQGYFVETVILFGGVNIITIEAHDRFGKGIKEELRITATHPVQ